MSGAHTEQEPIRVAILGTGPAALAAAWGLSAPENEGRYEITMYQVGWRSGGLCATGRVKPEYWVNQNGSHYFFGAYDNAFNVLRTSYDELTAAGETQFGDYEGNFVPRNLLVLKQFFDGNWTDWAIEFPSNTLVPGEGDGLPPVSQLICEMLQWMSEFVLGARFVGLMQKVGVFPRPWPHPTWLGKAIARLRRDWNEAISYGGTKLVELAVEVAVAAFGTEDKKKRGCLLQVVVWLLTEFRRALWLLLAPWVDRNVEALRAWQMLDLGISAVIGMIEDKAYEPGALYALDAWDLREWLQKWGANDLTAWSPPLNTWYNAISAYEQGDVSKPSVSCGLSIRCIGRLVMTYRGAFTYQLSWSVGDSSIGPQVGALKQRGVKFAYFHRVWDLVPSEDGNRITKVEMERQVELKSGDPLSYEPFILDKGRKVWPDEPRWGQIVDPDPDGIPLDNFYAPRKGQTVVIEQGKDYDVLISAMGLATYRWYASQLTAQKKAWSAMVEQMQSAETASIRLWFHDSLKDLGWNYGPPILSNYVNPFNTWEDPTPLLPSESWPQSNPVKTISHIFAPMPCPMVSPGPDPANYDSYWKKQQERADAMARDWLEHAMGSFYPDACQLRQPYSLDWSTLAQHQFRANSGPPERYTQVIPGTFQYRMKPWESGYANLYLAGDWTNNGMDVGTYEGAVMSGLLASQHLSGFPTSIAGMPSDY